MPPPPLAPDSRPSTASSRRWRIRRWYWKVAYAVGAYLLVSLLNLAVLSALPYTLSTAVSLVEDLVIIVVGARVFRGSNEEPRAPRPWWRFTARPTLSGAVGVLAAIVFAIGIVGIVISAFTDFRALDSVAGGLAAAAISLAFYGLIAALYLNSYVRLRQELPFIHLTRRR
ncbi:hypothetical protein [Galbitalea soli]|uniref:Uncharacterized protein n=1 Tax=Galbitalea soli TaxID=1268042 RepID=A0A7C9PNG2_9MICO|nr:hypothetical protein [Galbitalea soli]NEM91527.1 hypothetical protein [Galbitalea soli]NYJ30221.1 hypothetical protein [Galbitalea soli]